MNRPCLFALFPGALVVVVLTFVVALLLVKLLWVWTVPDLLPGAVEEGLVAATISWFTAFKLAVFVAVLAGIGGAHRAGRP